MCTTLSLFLLGYFFARSERITPSLYPYLAFACASAVVASLFLVLAGVVRYGAMSGQSPWDGEARLITALLLFFIPRAWHIPLGLSTVLNVISAAGLEILLANLLSLYGYECSCYALPSKQLITVNECRTSIALYVRRLAGVSRHD